MTPTGSTGGLRIEGVEKAFGEEEVLHGLDLTVDPGEFCIVIGPSGSGKSTLLKCIAGLVDPDAGRVLIDGTDIGDTPVDERDIGFVFQEFDETLFPHMTVAENVAFGLEQSDRDYGAEEIDRRVTEMLDLLAIAETRADRPGELSGGQQQRVELARQLIRGCSVMLFDDPLSDLDYKLQKRMELEFRRFHADTGGTYLYVTHNQEQALTLADTLVVLNDGQLEQAGTPTEVYERPQNAYVGRFVGDSTLFEARATDVDGDGTLVATTPVGSITARPGHDGIAAGDEGVILVRPENVLVGADADAATNRFDGAPTDRTYSGERTEFLLTVGNGDDARTVEAVYAGNARIDGFRDCATLAVGWDGADATFFSRLSVTGEITVADLREL